MMRLPPSRIAGGAKPVVALAAGARPTKVVASIHRLVRAVRGVSVSSLLVSTDSMASMDAFDPHVEAARLAAASFRQLALRATSEVRAALTALATMALFAPEPIFGSESATTYRIALRWPWREAVQRRGWHARVQAQQLAGVRALYMAIGCALVEDLDRLTDLGPLDEQLPKVGPARQHLDAFQVGLGRLGECFKLGAGLPVSDRSRVR
jgi:hypothetical protein